MKDDVTLIDDRSHPGFREIYGALAAEAAYLDAAVQRIRLSGLVLRPGELGNLRRIRVLLGETNALVLAAEAETLAATLEGRRLVRFLHYLLENHRMEIRIAPFAGWNPDFSVFTRVGDPSSGDPGGSEAGGTTLMLGPHWLERPYPHAGPALGVVLHGAPATRAGARFEEVWEKGHDLRSSFLNLFRRTLRIPDQEVDPGLTLSRGSGYSLRTAGSASGVDPV